VRLKGWSSALGPLVVLFGHGMERKIWTALKYKLEATTPRQTHRAAEQCVRPRLHEPPMGLPRWVMGVEWPILPRPSVVPVADSRRRAAQSPTRGSRENTLSTKPGAVQITND